MAASPPLYDAGFWRLRAGQPNQFLKMATTSREFIPGWKPRNFWATSLSVTLTCCVGAACYENSFRRAIAGQSAFAANHSGRSSKETERTGRELSQRKFLRKSRASGSTRRLVEKILRDGESGRRPSKLKSPHLYVFDGDRFSAFGGLP